METKLLSYKDNPENRARLFDFYKQVYPDSPWLLDNQRFEWQNLLNPLIKDDEAALWLLYDENGDIIGQNIYIYYNLSIDKRDYRGFCSTNLIVKPDLVGKRIGHKMIEKNESFNGVAYAVGITPASTRAFQKRGWVYITDARMVSRIINPLPNLKYLKQPLWMILPLFPVIKSINVIFKIISLIKVPRSIKGVSYREIDSFNPDMDSFWSKYLEDYGIYFKRESGILNYKYCTRKDVKHTIMLFEKNGVPVGYGVCRLSVNDVRKIRLGRIVDLVFDPSLGQKLLKYMISVLTKKLQAENIDGLVGVAANKEVVSAFRQNGLYFSRIQPAIIKEEDFGIKNLRSRYKYLWYITLGDSDLDNYW